MIYHGSTIQNLKIIEPKESTQKGSYVYGTPNMITAAIFAIAQRTGKPFPPLCRLKPGHQSMAERFENQFASLENMPISIYELEEKNFKSFKDNPSGHSSGDEIELRAEGAQSIKKEIKIDNVLEFLRNNGVTLYEYKDREKVGIPKSNKYFIKGIFTTYLWKIEGRTIEDFKRGEIHLETYKKELPEFSELIDEIKNIVIKLSEEESVEFIKNIYNSETDTFNKEIIEKTKEYTNNLTSETINSRKR